MACDCKTDKTRSIVQSGGNPNVVIRTIIVTVASNCKEIELPKPKNGDNGEDEDNDEYLTLLYREPCANAAAASMAMLRLPQKVCVNSVAVSLDKGTTAGLTITEVTLGNDTFATTIAVGAAAEIWDEICLNDCEEKLATVKVSDAAGKVVATIDNFRVCRCKP